MSKIVLELQKKAMDSTISITDILRHALIVSTKLKIREFKHWIKKELNGYPDKNIPDYRNVNGEIKAQNPYRGWLPVIFGDDELNELFKKSKINQPISELEDIINSHSREDKLVIPLPQSVIDKTATNYGCVPYLVVPKSQIAGVIDSVRTIVLEWSLKLESDGILGEDLTFSDDEINKASNITYNINQFSGVIGNVDTSTIQIGNYNNIYAKLKELGVSQKERNEIENIINNIEKAEPSDKKKLLARGYGWIKRNASTIGTFSSVIKYLLDNLS